MNWPPYLPPVWLRSGLLMTIYTALWGRRHWQETCRDPEPDHQEQIFVGAEQVPIYGWVTARPEGKGTLVMTYGITGSLEDQWLLRILRRKAVAAGYGVVMFDWRAHGRTAALSPTLTSDGLFEGEDFRQIAQQAQDLGCPGPFWLIGYSLGGQLALWGAKAIQDHGADLVLGGTAVICPSLESERSLRYLMQAPQGRFLEKRITATLKDLAWDLYRLHPESFDPEAIQAADSIWGFDQHLVIPRLGFESVEAYYAASSPLPWLQSLNQPTLILYAADDPMFDPSLVSELESIGAANPALDLVITPQGGHVGYLSSTAGQRQSGDPDPWWAVNRILEWIEAQTEREETGVGATDATPGVCRATTRASGITEKGR